MEMRGHAEGETEKVGKRGREELQLMRRPDSRKAERRREAAQLTAKKKGKNVVGNLKIPNDTT